MAFVFGPFPSLRLEKKTLVPSEKYTSSQGKWMGIEHKHIQGTATELSKQEK